MLLLGIIVALAVQYFGIFLSGNKYGLLFIDIGSFIIGLFSPLALILASYGVKGINLVFRALFIKKLTPEDVKRSINVYKDLRLFAIISGWIAFMIGLIIMLANLESIVNDNFGPGMAIALVSPFYGYILAYFICLPIQRRLETALSL